MRAVYPGYMQMKDDVGRLYSAFVRVWGVIALLAIPSAVGIACLAQLMTLVVLGPKWVEAAPLIGALALIGALQALNSCYWPMLLTRLGPRTVFRLAALGVAVTIPVFGVVLWTFGLMPAIAAWILCGVVMLFVGARWLLNDLGHSMLPLAARVVQADVRRRRHGRVLDIRPVRLSCGTAVAVRDRHSARSGGFWGVGLRSGGGVPMDGGGSSARRRK